MPSWLLFILAGLSLALPTALLIGAVTTRVFRQIKLRLRYRATTVVLIWILLLGLAVCMQILGHARHPDWWRFTLGDISGEPAGGMAIAIYALGGIHALIVMAVFKPLKNLIKKPNAE